MYFELCDHVEEEVDEVWLLCIVIEVELLMAVGVVGGVDDFAVVVEDEALFSQMLF